MDLLQRQNWTYLSDLPPDIGLMRELLQRYSRIPVQEIDQHLHDMRNEAWKISNDPCIGRWKFLTLIDPTDPRYQQVLFRLNLPHSTDVLLDLGCCLGQVLRQYRADGVRSAQLFGTDVNSQLIDVGYRLFRDRKSLGVKMIVGDMTDPGDKRLSCLKGKVTLIHATSFFHLFSWTSQLEIAQRLVSFLKPGTKNAIIFGRQAGMKQTPAHSTQDPSPYLHSEQSFQRLWDEVGELTSTKWLVEVEQDGELTSKLPGIDNGVVPVKFTVYQIP